LFTVLTNLDGYELDCPRHSKVSLLYFDDSSQLSNLFNNAFIQANILRYRKSRKEGRGRGGREGQKRREERGERQVREGGRRGRG
jgi:hypothetical protein